jgi:SPP1 family predicted phage head-tail adaptor
VNRDSGFFDRRIQIQTDTSGGVQDNAGDPIPEWENAFRLWANKSDGRGVEFTGAQQQVREHDTVFEIRDSVDARGIAPESHRVTYLSRIYEIVGVTEGKERQDTLLLLCSTRPDRRGARAPLE